jgi:molybdopterin biosynthesis enzyme
MVSLELFVRPALLAMQGAAKPTRDVVTVETTEELRRSDRIEYQRAVVTVDPTAACRARVNRRAGLVAAASMSGANAFLIVEPGDGSVPAGSRAPAILLDLPRGE